MFYAGTITCGRADKACSLMPWVRTLHNSAKQRAQSFYRRASHAVVDQRTGLPLLTGYINEAVLTAWPQARKRTWESNRNPWQLPRLRKLDAVSADSTRYAPNFARCAREEVTFHGSTLGAVSKAKRQRRNGSVRDSCAPLWFRARARNLRSRRAAASLCALARSGIPRPGDSLVRMTSNNVSLPVCAAHMREAGRAVRMTWSL